MCAARMLQQSRYTSPGRLPMKRFFLVSFVLSFVAFVTAAAQQPPAAGAAPGRGRGQATAPPGINWPSPPLPDGPIVLDTALVRPVKITVTKGLNQPWSMVFLPDGGILITERGGTLRMVRNGVLDPNPVAGLPPDTQANALAGLVGI